LFRGRTILEGKDGITQWRVGDKAKLSKKFTKEDVEQFARLSLDDNPIHLDENYAAKTSFKKCIVHGMLTSSVLSAVLGTKLPGKVFSKICNIYDLQTFHRAVFTSLKPCNSKHQYL
jgi:acyl dehydratase